MHEISDIESEKVALNRACVAFFRKVLRKIAFYHQWASFSDLMAEEALEALIVTKETTVMELGLF